MARWELQDAQASCRHPIETPQVLDNPVRNLINKRLCAVDGARAKHPSVADGGVWADAHGEPHARSTIPLQRNLPVWIRSDGRLRPSTSQSFKKSTGIVIRLRANCQGVVTIPVRVETIKERVHQAIQRLAGGSTQRLAGEEIILNLGKKGLHSSRICALCSAGAKTRETRGIKIGARGHSKSATACSVKLAKNNRFLTSRKPAKRGRITSPFGAKAPVSNTSISRITEMTSSEGAGCMAWTM